MPTEYRPQEDLIRFEMTDDREALDRFVDHYTSLRSEEAIDSLEDCIDRSPFADDVYRAINRAYIRNNPAANEPPGD